MIGTGWVGCVCLMLAWGVGPRSGAQIAGAALSGAEFANTLPTFLIAGYQQLGSPPNTAADFSTM